MYVSDYMYAVDPTGWTKLGYDSASVTNDYRAIKGDNWMYMGFTEWTLSRRSVNANFAFFVSYTGYVSYGYVYYSYGVRPSFYLKSDVEISGGSGTAADPYRIA